MTMAEPVLVFDTAANMPSLAVEDGEAQARASFLGPAVDPGGDPIQTGTDAAGTFVTLAGRRVPVVVDGTMLRVGLPGRLGNCIWWGLVAVDRLLHERLDTAQGIALCFGSVFGCSPQTFAQYFDAGRWWVWDLTLSDQPFPRAEYLRAAHIRAGTTVPISNHANLQSFARRCTAWSAAQQERRASEALARQQKAGN